MALYCVCNYNLVDLSTFPPVPIQFIRTSFKGTLHFFHCAIIKIRIQLNKSAHPNGKKIYSNRRYNILMFYVTIFGGKIV